MLLDNSLWVMDSEKAQFKRLIELMGWSQSEAARRLHKTPSAINHLVNPDHPNKPTETTMQFLKIIIASERPDLINAHMVELEEGSAATEPETVHLSSKEREIVEGMRRLPSGERQKVYTVMKALLRLGGRKGGK